jgi:ribosome maturation factor RimP
LKVTLDREGGIDLETIAEATRRISREFDLLDPISSKYTLEVSSPGLERVLRTEDHWRRAMGSLVQVKLKRHAEGERRVDGEIRSIEEGVATLALDGGELLQVHLDDVDRAKTRLLWGPEARTSQSPSGGGKRCELPSRQKGRGEQRRGSVGSGGVTVQHADG